MAKLKVSEKNKVGTRVVVSQGKQPLATPASQIQLPTNVPDKAADNNPNT